MEVQPSLVLLQKTLLNIEGLGRQLYPELNLWDTAQPFLERWVQERYSPQSMLKRLQRHAPSWLEQLPQLPDAVFESLQHSKALDSQARQQQQDQERLKTQERAKKRRQKRQILAGFVLILAVVTAIPGGWQQLANVPLVTWILAGLGLALVMPGSDSS